jgi:hypothetical protein
LSKRLLKYVVFFGVLFLSGCQLPARLTPAPPSLPTVYAELVLTLTPGVLQSNEGSPGQITPHPKVQVESQQNTIWLHPGLPENFLDQVDITAFTLVENPDQAALKIQLIPIIEGIPESTFWTYVLVAPFYTVKDQLSLSELSDIWQGTATAGFDQIFISEKTEAALEILLGKPNDTTVKNLDQESLESYANGSQPVLTIIPFEELQPEWKVLRIDGVSPIDAAFIPAEYPLTLAINVEGSIGSSIIMPGNNYDPDKRTTLIMTGVTALTRATAYQMEIRGNTFPGTDIKEWLTSADLTHISNEVPFAENCPMPDPNQPSLIFCSSPDRIELLEDVGADIIELTGNHMLDYGVAAMNLTLEMYEERGWTYYAGGWDLSDARTPKLITHNGNNLAFIGCNPVGPPNDYATSSQPGSAPCGDYDWIVNAISTVKADGYLPIVTLQYAEDYTAVPSAQMIADFQRLADAGAMVVNGSQAHTPKLMAFYNEGLGNLFFDQMEVYYGDTYMPNTRDEFIDRLVFYDNRLVSVELLTAELEDFARPRPMTTAEREAFLWRIFDAAQGYIEELIR